MVVYEARRKMLMEAKWGPNWFCGTISDPAHWFTPLVCGCWGAPLEKPLLLLVEDEALLAMGLQDELKDAGFEVLLAKNGQVALAEIEQDVARFAGLISDIRLPEVDGWTIAKRARELMPTIPVVYMSGDSAADWAAYGVPDSVMLAKPFAEAQLVTAISTLINAIPPSAT